MRVSMIRLNRNGTVMPMSFEAMIDIIENTRRVAMKGCVRHKVA